MKFSFNKDSFRLPGRQGLAIALILLAGIAAGAAIFFSGAGRSASDGHAAHAEAPAHADGEHHGAGAGDDHAHADRHDDDEHHDEATPKTGPHGGRLFVEQGLTVELLLAGNAPRAWLFADGRALPPTAGEVSLTLARPGGETQEIAFVADHDALRGTQPVAEPHLFTATLAARVGGQALRSVFAEEDGKIALSDEQIAAAGIVVRTAGPLGIRSVLRLPGEIGFNQDRTAHVVPRLAGVVESVPANLGQTVKKGQVLAVIASTALSEQRSELLAAQKRLELARSTYAREKQLWEEKVAAEQDYLQARQALREAEIGVANARQKLVALGAGTRVDGELNRYEIRAPFAGMVVEKHIALGEAVREDANIFTVSDLSSVWAEVVVPARELGAVRVGAPVTVVATAFDSRAEGSISYIGALLGQDTRTAKARVTLPNPGMAWRPGLFVGVEVVAGADDVPVAVATEALQTVDGESVVFVRVPGGFAAQPVTTGRTDGKSVEIVAGLKAGASYAASGSFVLKSELGKGSAEHGH